MTNRPRWRASFGLARRYSAQVCFSVLLTGVLTISVGEGQTYNIGDFSDIVTVRAQTEGYAGKPELFQGQTVLTGEVQQAVAIVYTVEKGDSIISIATRYNLSVGSVLDANNLTAAQADKIKPGAELLIPAEDTNTSLAWLDDINKLKEAERKKAEAERKKQLALREKENTRSKNSRTTARLASGSYGVIGRLKLAYNGGIPGQCTNYVLSKRPDLPRRMGNGGQYLASARSYGLSTGKTAQVGAVIVTTESRYGHVGIVESVNSGEVTLTDMNYAGPYIVTRRTMSVNSSVIRGYVY